MYFAELIGKTVGEHYKINSMIGSGGVSAIFDAYHTDTGDHVAIKILRMSLSETIHKMRFDREASLVSKMKHPNICQLYEYWLDEDGIPFMAIELIKGQTIAEIVESSEPIDLKTSVSITNDICEGLEYAHNLGVIHRDLKPENLMIENIGTTSELVKILDFGLAKDPSDLNFRLTQPGVVAGTPGYMSPEQINCDSLDKRTDLYSLACVFFFMITGDEIFQDQNPMEQMKKHVSSELRIKGRVPDKFLPFFDIALNKDRNKRFESAKDFSKGLKIAMGL